MDNQPQDTSYTNLDYEDLVKKFFLWDEDIFIDHLNFLLKHYTHHKTDIIRLLKIHLRNYLHDRGFKDENDFMRKYPTSIETRKFEYFLRKTNEVYVKHLEEIHFRHNPHYKKDLNENDFRVMKVMLKSVTENLKDDSLSDFMRDVYENEKALLELRLKEENNRVENHSSKTTADSGLISCGLPKTEILGYFMLLAGKKILAVDEVEYLVQSNFESTGTSPLHKKRFAVKGKIMQSHLRYFVYKFFKEKANYKPVAKRYAEFLIDNFDTESDNIKERDIKINEIQKNWNSPPARYIFN